MQPPHKVDLNNAEKTILVQLLKSSAALSVVSNYKQLAKFNVRELSTTDEEQQKAMKAASAATKEDAEPAAASAEEAGADKEAGTQAEQDTGIAEQTVPSTAGTTDAVAAQGECQGEGAEIKVAGGGGGS